ncbi:pitrilysin family protein [Chromobacterium sp. IIBBL 290-4]|uniref:M16 family metallopeptidase n=1 Tax=Chromobacterium sp. IIBBL 290-4 TaxID=2953890 RepID=UPI0020B77B8C|nr:pitrilysin family protein [Chromobacterium sp. IIBBL 290-4]UTH75583.1 insulinase family protein [Chromobacterium sp. IIBBL 290-4]
MRIKHLALAIALSIAPAAAVWADAAPVAAAQATLSPYAVVEGISEYRLANGLRVLLAPDASKPVATINLTYLVGSRHESYGETGMAHLLEHMMFKGTGQIANVMDELSRRGFQSNASTAQDRTNYYESFPAGEENLAWALGMEADRMVNSRIDQADFDKEFSVVRNEMEKGESDPFRTLWKQLTAASFDWHNYGHNTIGARSDVEKVKMENLRAFYRKYYQPDNAVLVIGGKFDPAQALALAQNTLGKLPKPQRQLVPTWTVEPQRDGERQITVRRVGDTHMLAALYHASSGSHPDWAGLEMLDAILTDNPNGRLYKSLVNRKLAVGVWPVSMGLAEPGYVSYWLKLSKEQNSEPARKALLGTLEDFKRHPVTQQELDRARSAWLSDFSQTAADSQSLTLALTEAIAQGDWRLFFLQRDRIEALQPADVQRVAENYLKASNRTLGEYLPTAKPDRSAIPDTPDVAKMVEGYQGKAQLSQGENFDPSPANIDQRTERATLPNGAKLALLPKKTRGNTISGYFAFQFGNAANLAGKATISQLTSAMLLRGAGKLSASEISSRIDQLKASLQISGSGQNLRVGFSVQREQLPALLALIGDALKSPTFPADEFAKLKLASQSNIDSLRNNPQSQAYQSIAKRMDPYPAGDIRHFATLDEQSAALKAATLEQLKAFQREFYGAGHAQFALVGDFDAAAVKRQLGELFGDWNSRQAYSRLEEKQRADQAGSEQLQLADQANAVYFAALPLALQDDSPDYPALLVANRILGGETKSRLFQRLRQQDGLSYHAGSDLMVDSFAPVSQWILSAIYAPQNLAKIKTGVSEELARLLKDGVTAEEVADAKHSLQQARQLARAQDDTLSSALAGQLERGRTMAFSAGLERQIEALTTEQVNAALRRYLQPSQLVEAYAGDFAATAKTAKSGS